VDTHRIRYFLSIADEGSINRAATVLGVAQPALSRQVRLLEEDLGVTLFRRSARGVQLTEEGERLRAATAAPLRQLELAMRYAGSPLARIERGLHIGVESTAADVLAVSVMDSLGAALPNAVLRLTVASNEELFKEMLRGSVDVAVTAPPADDRVFFEEFVTERLVVVANRDAELRPEVSMTFAEALSHPLVLAASRAGIRASIENTALRLKLTIRSRFETDSCAVARELIAAGRGYGILPLSTCAAEVATGRLRYAPLAEPALTSALGVSVGSKTDLPRGVSTKVSDLIRDEIARLVRSKRWPATLSDG
jgi:DNA-binding transcriptional LysR family regulator